MSRTFVVRPLAEQDLRSAFQWYERQRGGLGHEFLDEFERVFHRLSTRPEEPPIVYREVRKALGSRFPYAVLFVVDDSHTQVVAVAHSSRDPKGWRSRLD